MLVGVGQLHQRGQQEQRLLGGSRLGVFMDQREAGRTPSSRPFLSPLPPALEAKSPAAKGEGERERERGPALRSHRPVGLAL